MQLQDFQKGQGVILRDTVRHAEYRGLIGTVKRVVKSRGVVTVNVRLNGCQTTYDAFPDNLFIPPKNPNF